MPRDPRVFSRKAQSLDSLLKGRGRARSSESNHNFGDWLAGCLPHSFSADQFSSTNVGNHITAWFHADSRLSV